MNPMLLSVLPHHPALGQLYNWGCTFVMLSLQITSACFSGWCLQRASFTHLAASSWAKCCANDCLTLPSIHVLMEIHNLWRPKCYYANIRSDWPAAVSVVSISYVLCSPFDTIMHHCPAEQIFSLSHLSLQKIIGFGGEHQLNFVSFPKCCTSSKFWVHHMLPCSMPTLFVGQWCV